MYLHGWGGGVVSFLPLARILDRFDSLLFDFPGFGDSPLEDTLTLEDYAKKTLELLDENGIGKAVFVTHSFGSRVGAYIAANSPEKVAGLVIADGAGLRPRRGLKYYFKVVSYKIKKRFRADVSCAGSQDYRVLSPEMKRVFVNIVNRYTEDECRRVKCPTLIVWGKEDRDTPKYMAKRFRRLIKDSALVTLDGGHFCYIENLSAFAAIVGKFVSGVCGGVACGGN